MFGYVTYDLPNLYVKDLTLYRALYCGLCKGIGETCGQIARFGLSYDLAFISALAHNIAGSDVKIEKQHCFEHVVGTSPIANVDGLTRQIAALNTILVYYKLLDDVEDEKKGGLRRQIFKNAYRRAKKAYPQIDGTVAKYMKEQVRLEKMSVDSPDRAADPSAVMMREISVGLLGEHSTEHTKNLFYALGKWVYLIDALDDYDKDVKKKAYNPFYLAFGSEKREQLMKEHGKEVSLYFDCVLASMRSELSQIKFYFNRDLTDNIILRGIPLETVRIMKGEKRKKKNEIVH